MGSLLVHFTAVGVLIAQHVAGELDDHHLHTQTDAEGGDVVGASVFGGDNLALDTACAEAWTDDDARQSIKFFGYVLGRDFFAVDEVDFGLHIVIDTCEVQAFADALVGVLQVIFAHQADV